MLRLLLIIFLLTPLGHARAQNYVPGEMIVKMKNSGSVNTQNVARKMSASGFALKQSWPNFNTHQFKLRTGQNVEEAIEEISDDPNVEYAEPNYIFTKQSLGIQGQPMSYSELQKNMQESFSSGGDSRVVPKHIRAEETWPLLTPERGTPVVAVVDSGCDYNHYVFAESGAIWENEDEIPGNGIDDDGNGKTDDTRGWDFANKDNDPMDDDNHGTHVSGIILGITQNILKTPLDRARIRIMCLKFLNHEGMGNTADAIAAIDYAINNGAHVINNSWGGQGFSQALLDAIVKSYEAKRVFVAAAGNFRQDNDRVPNYPANYKVPNLISIAATTNQDQLAGFSNYGVKSVHLGSPGDGILSTLPNNSFGYNSGTSMAAPFVSGLAALMIREGGLINGYQIREIFLGYSQEVQGLPVSSESRIDTFNMINFVQNNEIPETQPEYKYNPDDYNYRGLAFDEFESLDEASGCGLVAKVLHDSKKGGPGGSSGGTGSGLFLGLLFAPLFLLNFLRIHKKRKLYSRRRHSRYKMESEVCIGVDGQQLIGQMSSISVDGASIDTDILLEQGGIVTLNISSPDGQQQLEVQGRVVWSQEKKAYGLQFCNAKDETRTAIGSWTKSLSKI